MSDSQILESRSADGRGFRVVFSRAADRFQHELIWLEAGRETLLMRSLEGKSSDATDWPPSPVFQQLHLESRGEDRVALLVGMAGKTHFSAAIETRVADSSLTFDMAARVQRTPEFLGSSYQLTTDLGLLNAFEIQPETASEMKREGARLEIRPALRGSFSLPATLRWRYQVSLRRT